MTTKAMVDILAENPFFTTMPRAQMELVAGCAVNAVYHEGDYLFREGEAADYFFLIRHGSVALELAHPSRGAVVVETLGEGDVIGWSWLVEPYRWMFDARARETLRVVKIDGACLRGKCVADHALGYELYRRVATLMADAITAAKLQLMDVYGGGRS
ncbi:MAG: cyclic nucleotide-binding domain-containing protein [Nitrospinae bacterium]|nr:cyclic nucleotide-binding domain-containing protein [Nitrospinota bacterium]